MMIKVMSLLLFWCFTSQTVSLIIPRRYESIINFGNSISDTGNYLLMGAPAYPAVGKLPYAEAFDLPSYLPPYLGVANGSHVRNNGVNFAVAGATALDPEFFYAQNIGWTLWTNSSLNVQLGWFKKFKSSLCHTKHDCEEYFRKTLFLVGEIGGNDYNFQFLAGATIDQIRPIVPLVVGAIVNATSMLIEEGATELVVPGNFPLGCSVVYLALVESTNQSDYDPTNGCLKAYNSFSEYHNEHLKRELQVLREKYPNARIIYADYYGAAIPLYLAPKLYGFYGGPRIACCGGGGPYNYDLSAWCGDPGSTACENPSAFVNWDGIHFTEAAYRYIAQGVLCGPHASPPLMP
ncbi:GDSL esterase/lipase At5g45910-like isoform X2 [Syzygium oleosum]|uniref:GDSL esterase/lipase At5g45910-like isoform X2 n=1 Tax=Syzygium oleosum TaxID=219896 RepID=UPI0024BABB7B|nr:GDSL esterase/lipase At5g45910-like isoform X2 [Syzygium oleosum]